ncbi:hypothetical protein K4A83_15630 [Spirulina subsalsa FACHB-351]|uniref:Uncharacterized protein n=1 Tax=Spirulina subsalsa FACHB-351 TaxID=234711 RepID=A0ABT3L967_9CYAN|nr:hypothetical protein [Spirulina subsalsa]MCW6037692.1 hypothetical protein [Spirulina subsalsa FACHB-351]
MVKRLDYKTAILTKPPRDRQIIRLTTPPGFCEAKVSVNRQGGWRLGVFWLIMAVTLLGGAGISGLWLVQLVPERTCDALTPMTPASERLWCGQVAAQTGDFQGVFQAIAEIDQWSEDHPLYKDAQELIEDWTRLVLATAAQHLDQGDLGGALELARQLPNSESVARLTQTTLTDWETQWQEGEELAEQFETAIQQQAWSEAEQVNLSLGQHPLDYWRVERRGEFQTRLQQEQRGAQLLAQAQQLAGEGTVQSLDQAIQLVNQIEGSTYIKGQAQVQQSFWSRWFLEQARLYLQQGGVAEAIALVERIPPQSLVYPQAQDCLNGIRALQNNLGRGGSLPPTLLQLCQGQ